MSGVLQKLKSRTGASMIIALTFFLLCVMIGSAVLTASSVNVGRAARAKKANQQRLAVTSAARLIASDLQGAAFQGVYQRVDTVTTTVSSAVGEDGKEETSTSVSQASEVQKAEGKTGFSGTSKLLLESALPGVSQLYYSRLWEMGVEGFSEAPPSEIACTLSFEEVADQGIPAVTGTLTMDRDYGITVTLQDDQGGNQVKLIFAPVISTPTESTEITVTGDDVSSSKVTRTYYTTTVTWDEPLISGGGQ